MIRKIHKKPTIFGGTKNYVHSFFYLCTFFSESFLEKKMQIVSRNSRKIKVAVWTDVANLKRMLCNWQRKLIFLQLHPLGSLPATTKNYTWDYYYNTKAASSRLFEPGQRPLLYANDKANYFIVNSNRKVKVEFSRAI